jgi:hypothetical protein
MQPSQPRHDDVMTGRHSTQENALPRQPTVPPCTATRHLADGDSTMNTTLPPEAWRSEAFAEDLADESSDTPASARQRSVLTTVLLGVLPAALAAAGAVAAVFSGA